VPVSALIACGIAPAVFVLIGNLRNDALTAIVSFATIGIYIAFQMVVIGALLARWRGWKPSGAFRLGGSGWTITIAALVYGLAAITNIGWPRASDAPWYSNYAVLLSTVIIAASGLLYMMIANPELGVSAGSTFDDIES
jgi:amino acid transporter